MEAVVYVWRSLLFLTAALVIEGLRTHIPFPLALLGGLLTWASIISNFEQPVVQTIQMHFEEDEDDGTLS